jgi:hypothetical protein
VTCNVAALRDVTRNGKSASEAKITEGKANDRLANVSEWEPAGDLEFGSAGATPRRKAGLSRAPITPPQKS